MAIGSGLGASFGLAAESVYGTAVALTKFYAGTFNVKKQLTTVEISGVAAGRVAPPDEVVTTTSGTGMLQAQVLRSGFGFFLDQFMGGSAAPAQQAATAAYLLTRSVGDNVGKFCTAQQGTPDVGGTARPYTGVGGKFTSLEFSCAVNETLQMSAELDFKAITEVPTLTAPSYTAGNMPFHGGEMSVKLGTFNSEASVTGVRSVSIKLERPQDVERFYGGQAGAKLEPIFNDFMSITGTLEVDYITKADFVDRFVGHTSTSMVLEWKGTTAIASTYFPTIAFQCPKVYFSGDIPPVDGPNIMKASVPFKALLDTTNGQCIATYMSTDVTV